MPKINFDKVQFIDVDENYVGQRIDNFLFRELKSVPKSRIYRIIRKGEVRVNKKRVKAEYKLLLGDTLRIPPIKIESKEKEVSLEKFDKVKQLEESILFESNQFLLLNKPSGIAVHGGSGLSFGVIEALRSLRPQEKFLELVHRLDRDTSGCLLIAKRRSYLNHFQEQLKKRTMKKQYLAIVNGVFTEKNKIKVSVPLKKVLLKSGERQVFVDEQGKSSHTLFESCQRFKQHSLIKAFPLTGRTHQIRVHAKHIGHSLLGDTKYSDVVSSANLIKKKSIKTFFLHAHQLTFTTPDSEQLQTYEAPIPNRMNEMIGFLGARG